jgi:PTS system cellobiose-specific IIA component
MEELELACFQIISSAGMAKSSYIEAIKEAKKGDFNKARLCINEGDESYTQGHSVHSKLIQKEAGDKKTNPNLLLLHAEDQLMSVETCKIIACELIESYERIVALENRK